jgi:anti-sigma factor RsiW
MRCQEIVPELDAYLTGELDSVMSAGVERHIEGCAACRAEMDLIRRENAIYREYASAAGIPGAASNRLQSSGRMPKSSIHTWRWAAAAAILAAAVLSWRFYATRDGVDATGNVGNGAMSAIPVPVRQAVSSYEQALFLLQSSYQGKKRNLDPGLVRELDRNLRVAEAAVAECKLALEKHPDNPQVLDFLLLDYEKQLGILKQITEAL